MGNAAIGRPLGSSLAFDCSHERDWTYFGDALFSHTSALECLWRKLSKLQG
jgi:hypothetical protein